MTILLCRLFETFSRIIRNSNSSDKWRGRRDLKLAAVDKRVRARVELVVHGEQSLFFFVFVHLSIDVVEYVASQR